MTKTLNRIYFRKYEHNPDLFGDLGNFRPYRNNTTKSDEYWKRQRNLGREHLVIMHGIVPVGEVILKNIDPNQRCCTLGIHLRNDSVKNKGYGTAAEIMALQYTFHKLQCEMVYADAIHKNLRSQHVLERAGFVKPHQNARFA